MMIDSAGYILRCIYKLNPEIKSNMPWFVSELREEEFIREACFDRTSNIIFSLAYHLKSLHFTDKALNILFKLFAAWETYQKLKKTNLPIIKWKSIFVSFESCDEWAFAKKLWVCILIGLHVIQIPSTA
jgi:hypothetical protein